MSNYKEILLGHGSGGKMSHELITGLFLKHFGNGNGFAPDAAVLQTEGKHLAFTTDSFVVDPVFFPGGNIGKLAVCGTVNDLAVSGAKPMYLSCGFIIEEGFAFAELETIVESMAEAARDAGVRIVAGDTKVVNRGKCDKIFINTSGIGFMDAGRSKTGDGSLVKPGDAILINGYIADHGIAVMAARQDIQFSHELLSDCACLNGLADVVYASGAEVHFMRDATRGGLGAVVCELAEGRQLSLVLEESKIPLRESVSGFCEIFGFDPLYVANEGKVVMVVAGDHAEKALHAMRSHPLGKEADIIGYVAEEKRGRAVLNTTTGGSRIIDLPAGEQLPRIC